MSDEIEKLLRNITDKLQGQNREFAAMLDAQRFLLEIIFANKFVSHPEVFESLMQGMLGQTRSASLAAKTISEEDSIEAKVLVATYLERFRESVLRRISQA